MMLTYMVLLSSSSSSYEHINMHDVMLSYIWFHHHNMNIYMMWLTLTYMVTSSSYMMWCNPILYHHHHMNIYVYIYPSYLASSSGCQSCFLAKRIFSSSLEMSSRSAFTTFDHASQWSAVRCMLIWSITWPLSLIITKPRGLKSLSISRRRSSMPLQLGLSMSVKRFQACRRSYVLGYVEKAWHL